MSYMGNFCMSSVIVILSNRVLLRVALAAAAAAAGCHRVVDGSLDVNGVIVSMSDGGDFGGR